MDAAATDRFTVEISGARHGDAPVTWAQREIWDVIEWMGDDAQYFTMRAMVAIPEGVTMSVVREALRAVVGHVDVLRTRMVEGATGLRQHVDGSGVLTVPIHPAGRDEVTTVAQDLAVTMTAALFDLSREWPVRFALVLTGRAPAMLVLAASHAAVDGAGLSLLVAELARALRGDPLEPVEGRWQPLEQMSYEASDQGQRRNRRALRYRERILDEAPRTMFDLVALEPHAPRFVKMGISSPAIAVAADLLADRYRVSTSAVLLAAGATALSIHTGQDPVFLTINVGARVERRLQTMIGPMVQDGLFKVDVIKGYFGDLLRRTYLQALLTYQHGSHDKTGLATVRQEVEARRGFVPHNGAFFNDPRESQRWPELPVVRTAPDELAADLATLRKRSRTFHVGSWEQQDLTLFLSTADSPHSAIVHMLTDTVYVGVDTVSRMLAGMEALLVAAAVGDLDMADAARVSGIPMGRRVDRTG